MKIRRTVTVEIDTGSARLDPDLAEHLMDIELDRLVTQVIGTHTITVYDPAPALVVCDAVQYAVEEFEATGHVSDERIRGLRAAFNAYAVLEGL